MKIITISRKYAAGGHSIGRAVADRLGLELYDKDIIANTAEVMGVDKETIERNLDTMGGKGAAFIRKINPVSINFNDQVFRFQTEVILDIAKKGPCVFLGRCSEWILQNAGIDSFNVFLTADDVHRAFRTSELIGSTDPAEISRTIKKMDHERDSYYMYHTGRHQEDINSYNMILDSGLLGYDTCINLICEAAESL